MGVPTTEDVAERPVDEGIAAAAGEEDEAAPVATTPAAGGATCRFKACRALIFWMS